MTARLASAFAVTAFALASLFLAPATQAAKEVDLKILPDQSCKTLKKPACVGATAPTCMGRSNGSNAQWVCLLGKESK